MSGSSAKNGEAGARRLRPVCYVALIAAVATLGAGCSRSSSSSPGAAPGSAVSETGTGSNGSPGITDSEVVLGQSSALTGAVAGPGQCSTKGFQAYFGKVNAEGGVKFGDGKTRKIVLKTYDDAFVASRAVANFKQMQGDNVFAAVGDFATATNVAVKPLAAAAQIPQVMIISGASAFHDSADQWSIAWLPSYHDEGLDIGKFVAAANKPLKVGILAQNDDVGNSYISGFEEGIKGSSVEVVKITKYATSDTTVDSQINQLAASKADVYFSAAGNQQLAAEGLAHADSIGWHPTVFLSSIAAAISEVVVPGHGKNFPAVYSSGFTMQPDNPAVADDPAMKEYVAAQQKYAPDPDYLKVADCPWGYSAAAATVKAFEAMKSPTRSAFVAAIRSLENVQIPLILPGVSVGYKAGSSLVQNVQIQKFEDGRYVAAQNMG